MQVDYNDKIFNKIQELSSITKDKIEFLKKKLTEEDQNIDNIIKKYYLIDLEKYAQIKATVIGMPYKNLLDEKVNTDALKLLPINLSANYKMVIFNKRDKILDVGLVDPEDFSAIEAIEFLAHKNNYKLKYYLISEESFNSVFKKTENIKQQVNEALNYAKEEFEEIVDESQFDEENLSDIIKTAPVTKIISVLLKHAVEGRASDIHIEPVAEKSIIRFRIDGKLHNSIVLPIYIHNALIARVKVMANMKIDETRIPQDGRIRVAMKKGKDVKKIDFRVSTLPLIDYEKVVMRILSTPEKVPEFEELGFFGNSKRMIEEAISKPNGMILVTGPTGSGKSFTLFTALNKINSELINICTLEDPVEYNIEGINQSQVKPEVNYTFASGLRSLLRQDPDVIMVGEIRDSETAELAVHAALTGHLVFSTLHTNDAIGAIPRLIDMKIEPFLLSSTLNLVFAQRLVRRICDNCKEEMILPDVLKEQISSSINDLPESAFYGNVKKGDVMKFYHGKGCNRCGGTGYKGRIAINEVFVPNRALKDVVNEGNDMGKFQDELKKQGYINMMQDGFIKVLSGMTTLEEVLRATKEF